MENTNFAKQLRLKTLHALGERNDGYGKQALLSLRSELEEKAASGSFYYKYTRPRQSHLPSSSPEETAEAYIANILKMENFDVTFDVNYMHIRWHEA